MRVLRRVDEAAVKELLMADEEANTFMLGNLLPFGVTNKHRILRSGHYYGAYEDGLLCGVVALYNNSQCMVYCARESAARTLAEFLYMNPSPTIIGPAGTMDMLLRARPQWRNEAQIQRQYFMRQDTRIPYAPQRQISIADVRTKYRDRQMLRFLSQCLYEGFGYRTRLDLLRRVLKERQSDENYCVLYYADIPVAQAHIQAWTPTYGQIGGVTTLGRYRRNGYAQEIVAYLAQNIHDRGHIPSLLVDDDNEAAIALYRGLGFAPSSEQMVWHPK